MHFSDEFNSCFTMGGACPHATTAAAAEAIDSKLPLRPPRALNCGMALKRQETDHGKRKTKV